MARISLPLIALIAFSTQSHAFTNINEDSIRVCSELSETTYWSAVAHLGNYEKIRYNEAERRVTRRLLTPETPRTIENAKFFGESAHGNRGGANLSPNDARANALRATLDFYEQCLTNTPTNPEKQEAGTENTSTGAYIDGIRVEKKQIGQIPIGADIYFTIKNPNKNSAIKYMRMVFTTLNDVGDPIKDPMGNSQVKAKYTGPLTHEEGSAAVKYEHINTNKAQPGCIRIDQIEVEHMNGQTKKFDQKNIASAINPNQPNGCPLIK